MTTPSDAQLTLLDDSTFPTLPDASDAMNVVPDNGGCDSLVGGSTALPDALPDTLADAVAFAQQHHLLSDRGLADVMSAVKLLEKVTGLDADQLPAAPKDLTPIIERAHPGRYRIKPKRWSNATSLIRKLLRACGLHAPLMRGKPASNPIWDALIQTLPQSQVRARLQGFARFCSDVGIGPNEVGEQTLVAYIKFRQTSTIRTHVRQLEASIRRAWNNSVRAALPGWPSRTLTAPPVPHVEALPLTSFPENLRAELLEYLSSRTEPAAFGPDQEQWRPATAKSVRRALIYAASLTARQIGGPAQVTSWAIVVTVESFKFVLQHMFERSGRTWHAHALNMATYLMVLARDFVRVDADTLSQLDELRGVIAKRVGAQRKPGLSESVAKKMMPFDDPILLRRLFRLPGDLYKLASKLLESRPVRAAQMHEQALMLDLLQHDPMRRYNLATINFETDFLCDERGRINRLWISGDRTKNGIAIDTPIPPDLGKRLRTHRAVYRPHLRGSHSPWVFPSPKGEARAADNVTKTLGRIVERSLGVKFTPHMMRHIVATLLYRLDPNNGVVVQRKLRHAHLKTTERLYGVMSNAGANTEWQRELIKYRRAKTSSKRRK